MAIYHKTRDTVTLKISISVVCTPPLVPIFTLVIRLALGRYYYVYKRQKTPVERLTFILLEPYGTRAIVL